MKSFSQFIDLIKEDAPPPPPPPAGGAAPPPPAGGGAPPMGGGAPPMGGGAPPMGGGAPPMGGGMPGGAPPGKSVAKKIKTSDVWSSLRNMFKAQDGETTDKKEQPNQSKEQPKEIEQPK